METMRGPLAGVWRAAADIPLLPDLVLAAVLAWAVVDAADGRLPTVVQAAVALVSFLAVLLRRMRPYSALALATLAVAVGVWQHAGNPGLVVALGMSTYSVALRSEQRRGWVCATAASALLYAAAVVTAGGWWRPEVIGVSAWIFLAAATGEATRARRGYIAEVEERARRAEQTREEEARRRVMDERLRIARELHDVVAHHIAVISVQSGAARHLLTRRPEQVGPVLEHIHDASDMVLKEIQSVVGLLRNGDEADSGEPPPGVARLPELLGSLTATGFQVRHEQRGEPRDLPAVADLAAYRIVQEALTNAHRYGDGRARILLEYTRDGVVVEVTNEIGPAATGSGSGYGVLGMQERAASAGGRLAAGRTGDGRFRVHAVLPAEPPGEAPVTAGRRGPAAPTTALYSPPCLRPREVTG